MNFLHLRKLTSVSMLLAYGLLAMLDVQAAGAQEWGTFQRPFAADSLWNSKPVSPVLDPYVIPKSDYFPAVGEGQWSSGVFVAKTEDGPATIKGLPGSKGLWNPDAEFFQPDITLPHWPTEVIPASGADGHADVIDTVSGVVHSFWQLKKQGGQWVAAQYAWTRLDGRGWGDPAHYFQGARAAGVPTTGGLIRKNEVSDGQTLYGHALAISLTFNALAANPAYVFPATSADYNASSTNSGSIPEGALLMLPASFDTQQIKTPALRKVAETLKVYGAYVVDRNTGTPFYIYVENGSGFNLHPNGWNVAAATDLDVLRQNLKRVASTGGWIDGNGKRFKPETNLNLLSMRGAWSTQAGTAGASFDTSEQVVVLPNLPTRTLFINRSARGMNPVSWATPKTGATYKLTGITTGGAKLQLQLRDRATGSVLVDSGELDNGESSTFVWPNKPTALQVVAISGAGQVSKVRGELKEVPGR